VSFVIEEQNHRFSMKDPQKDAQFRFLSGLSRDMSDGVFLLDWKGYQVPVVADYDRRSIAPSTVVTIRSLGEVPNSSSIHRKYPDLTDAPLTRDDREECELIVAEALVVFGILYDGPNYPDGRYTVHIQHGPNAGDYTLSSFGYRGAGYSES
jgi:hypothetical protein